MEERVISELGIEMSYTINHFGHFYLTYLLFDSIKKAKEGRVINLSSGGHFYTSDDLLDDLTWEKNWSSLSVYLNSKMLNVLFTVGLKNLLEKKNYQSIKTACLNPGGVDTGAEQGCCAKFFMCLCCCLFVDTETGAKTSLHLSQIPLEEIKSGEYYDNDRCVKEMDKKGRDMELVRKLWEMSEKAYGIKFN